MITRIFILYLLIVSFLNAQNKGTLFIIGGGSIPDYLIEKYVELAGGKDSKFVIIPIASGEPVQSANSFTKRLTNAGCKNVHTIMGNRETVDCDSNMFKIQDANAIYFTGGDQSRLTRALIGSKLLEAIKKIYYSKKGVVGGTSAGAAVMSRIMITGDELINKDTVNAYNAILKGNIKTSEGFGFVDNAIVDQHFIKRKRFNRLLSLVLENKNLIGIGIDESTAIIVKPNSSVEVIGESLVTIIDGTKTENLAEDKNGHQSVRGIKVHLLKSGDKFSLKNFSFSVGNKKK